MPNSTVSDGDVVLASFWNANVRDQVISTVTSATRPAGTKGQMIYETDTDLVYVYSGSGWVQHGGIGAWTSYTPTLTQSSAITKTVTYARYFKVGRMVTVTANLAITATGTANNAMQISLPFTSAATGLWVGQGVFYDSSGTTVYPGLVALNTSTTMVMTDATAATPVNIFTGMTGATFGLAVASGDVIVMSATYEATS